MMTIIILLLQFPLVPPRQFSYSLTSILTETTNLGLLFYLWSFLQSMWEFAAEINFHSYLQLNVWHILVTVQSLFEGKYMLSKGHICVTAWHDLPCRRHNSFLQAVCTITNLIEVMRLTSANALYIFTLRLKQSTRILPKMFPQKVTGRSYRSYDMEWILCTKEIKQVTAWMIVTENEAIHSFGMGPCTWWHTILP